MLADNVGTYGPTVIVQHGGGDYSVYGALARIDVYAQRAPLAIGYAKMAVNTGLQMGLESALHYERQLTTTLFTTEDKREGMAAFLEKRAAAFKGR